VTFIPTADVVKVDANARLFGQIIDNTLWFKFRAGAPTLEDLIALGATFNTFWVGTMLPVLSQDYKYLGCVVTDQSSDSAPAIEAPSSLESGGVVDDSLAGGTCLCVTFLTGARGRSGRGRNYVSGVPQATRSGNLTTDAFAADLVAVYDAILGSPIDTDWEWSVVSHFTANAPRVAGLPQPVIGSRVADVNLDSQRRRLTGRGT
jgi:hypothetical protein